MRTELFYPSCGKGSIHACRWVPEGEIRGVVQLIHGIGDYAMRYDAFARHLNSLGFAVVANDHMGHGASIGYDGLQGYFHGGWFAAVKDVMTLMRSTMAAYPGVPYVLFGHSMGSFMARTILAKYPNCGISACVICGTAWQNPVMLASAGALARLVCKTEGEQTPSQLLHNLMFGSYNARVEHRSTPCDWISRDASIVRAYVADPRCGFVATAGLIRDMMEGIAFIQKDSSLKAMPKELPVLFVAGGDDPVGAYGKGVDQAFRAFKKAGMGHVRKKIYPLCRHEILNEINRAEIFRDLGNWIIKVTSHKE